MSALQLQIREYLSHIRVERNLARNTQLAYARDLSRYAEFLESLQIVDIGNVYPEHVNSYQAQLLAKDSGLTRASVNRMLAAVRGLHAFSLKEKWTSRDVCSQLIPSKAALTLPKALTVEIGRAHV